MWESPLQGPGSVEQAGGPKTYRLSDQADAVGITKFGKKVVCNFLTMLGSESRWYPRRRFRQDSVAECLRQRYVLERAT